jgi:hypothetical protein
MKITRGKLMETVNQEIKTVLVENYLRSEIAHLLSEYNGDMSSKKVESLLGDVITVLDSIDLSIDYLSAAITGQDAASIGIAQRFVGRGISAPKRAPQELSELDPHRTLAAQEEDEYEEPTGEPGDIEADTVLGGEAGEWQAAIEAEPKQRRPPREYRKKAIELLAAFHVNVDQRSLDVVAWQLYANAMNEPTQAMEEPPKKRKRFKFFENENLHEYIKEELEAYLEEEEKNNPWAICTDSVGREDKKEYEKCVKSIKAKNKGK